MKLALLLALTASTGCLSALPEGTVFACSGACDAGSYGTAVHAAWPLLTPLDGGATLSTPRLVTITTIGDPQAPNYDAFVQSIATGSWLAQVGQDYGVGAATYGGHVVVSAAAVVDGGLNYAGALAAVNEALDDGAPAPNGDTIYMVFAPLGTIYPGSSAAADLFWPFPAQSNDSLGDRVLVLYPITPSVSDISTFDFTTANASRGLLDAASASWGLVSANPAWEGSPSPDSPQSYAGQLATDSRIVENGFVYQRIWSNTNAAMGGDPLSPPLAQPYFSAGPEQAWYSVSAGQTIKIPFTGWSTAAVADWFVAAGVWRRTGNFSSLPATALTITTALGEEQIGTCNFQPALNNGVSGSLQVAIPTTVASGDYAILGISSLYEDPTNCDDLPPAQGDTKHWQYVGVYVP